MRASFVSVAAVPREEGGEIIYAVDKAGFIWRTEWPATAGAAAWIEVSSPQVPDYPRHHGKFKD